MLIGDRTGERLVHSGPSDPQHMQVAEQLLLPWLARGGLTHGRRFSAIEREQSRG
jgi:hypothetical protein